MDLIITIILPVVTKKDLPISPRITPYGFLSRCKFSTFTTRQPMVEFYLLTFPRFPLRKKEHKSYFDKNRTHDYHTTSGCAGYLLEDHSGDDAHLSYMQFQCIHICLGLLSSWDACEQKITDILPYHGSRESEKRWVAARGALGGSPEVLLT